MPDTLVYNEGLFLSVNDSLALKRLEAIGDTLNSVRSNTEPISNLIEYFRISEGRIAIIAMVISFFAFIASSICFIYQIKSTRLLQIANQRKPNLYPIVRKIYDNSITLQIIYEFDSDYTMSYSNEQKHSLEKRSSSIKHYFYSFYPSENVLCQMKLPEDIIMLEKYEVYVNDDIYNMAFGIMDIIIKYNENIERAIKHIQDKSSDDKIKRDKEDLLNYSRKLLRMMFDLDELVWKAEKTRFTLANKKRKDRQLEYDLLLFIASRFIAKTTKVTPDILMLDPFFVLATSVLDSPYELDLVELKKKYDALGREKPLSPLDIDDAKDKYLRNTVDWIRRLYFRERDESDNQIKKSSKMGVKNIMWFKKKKETMESVYRLSSKSHLKDNLGGMPRSYINTKWNELRLRIEKIIKKEDATVVNDTPFNDIPLRRNVEHIFSGINTNNYSVYDRFIEQIDNGILDMQQIVRYDTILQFFIQKYDFLTETNPHAYNKENRRIERKKMFMMEKIKQQTQ